MQATTYGVIPNKVRVYNNVDCDDFLENEKNKFMIFSGKSCLYSNKDNISDQSLNYLNLIPEKELDINLKNLILNEFYKCDYLYPYLGDYFLSKLFSNKKKSKKIFKYNKSYENLLISSLQDENVINIAKWLFDNITMERNIIVDDSGNYGDIFIEKIDDFIFNFNYDFDFYSDNPGLSIKNYRFIIIDGFLETVGEIHHLMTKANETKESYVIFCHGMSEEVKYTIMKNNKTGRTKVFPVSIDFNENTINILNDLAVIHNSYVVSSSMGQTISQETRKELGLGKEIIFYKEKLMLKSNVSEDIIMTHKKFLKQRLDDASKKSDINIDPIVNRLKMFSSKSLKLYIPKDISKNRKFSRELDYLIRTIQNFSMKFTIQNFNDKQKYFIPLKYEEIVENKINSLKNILYNINTVIIGGKYDN